jgi:hypothetical protein
MLRTGNTSQPNAYVIGIGYIGIIAYSIASSFRKMDKRKNDWEEKKYDWQVLRKRLRS